MCVLLQEPLSLGALGGWGGGGSRHCWHTAPTPPLGSDIHPHPPHASSAPQYCPLHYRPARTPADFLLLCASTYKESTGPLIVNTPVLVPMFKCVSTGRDRVLEIASFALGRYSIQRSELFINWWFNFGSFGEEEENEAQGLKNIGITSISSPPSTMAFPCLSQSKSTCFPHPLIMYDCPYQDKSLLVHKVYLLRLKGVLKGWRPRTVKVSAWFYQRLLLLLCLLLKSDSRNDICWGAKHWVCTVGLHNGACCNKYPRPCNNTPWLHPITYVCILIIQNSPFFLPFCSLKSIFFSCLAMNYWKRFSITDSISGSVDLDMSDAGLARAGRVITAPFPVPSRPSQTRRARSRNQDKLLRLWRTTFSTNQTQAILYQRANPYTLSFI